MVLGTRQKKRQRRDLHKALVAQGSGVNLFLVSTPCRTFFLGEDTNTFFSVKVRRVISVIRGRLLKEAAQSLSAPAETSGCEDFIRTIG